MFHKPLKEATKSLCQVYIIAYNWYRLRWWIFFIPCYNWKTYFFIQTHHYPEVWCNHNVTMLLTAMVTTYIKFYCINALNKIYLLVAFFPIFFQLVNVPHFFVNWILRLLSQKLHGGVFLRVVLKFLWCGICFYKLFLKSQKKTWSTWHLSLSRFHWIWHGTGRQHKEWRKTKNWFSKTIGRKCKLMLTHHEQNNYDTQIMHEI